MTAGILWRAGVLALAVALAGCASDRQRIEAINAVNEAFRARYETILAEEGSKVFKLSRDEAFVSMRVALAGLGMRTETQDMSLGYLVVASPAPRPLTVAEWDQVTTADLPLLQTLVQPYVGSLPAIFVHFEPQGLETVVSASFLRTAGGAEISITARLREVSPPRSGWPRREYLPPTAVRMGLAKIWGAFEQEVRAGPQRP
jgi:hypothetical protein